MRMRRFVIGGCDGGRLTGDGRRRTVDGCGRRGTVWVGVVDGLSGIGGGLR